MNVLNLQCISKQFKPTGYNLNLSYTRFFLGHTIENIFCIFMSEIVKDKTKC